MAKGARKL